jgi:hypothetical protein
LADRIQPDRAGGQTILGAARRRVRDERLMTFNTKGQVVGETASTGKASSAADPPLSELDALQLLLDLGGMVPGAGAIADLLNAAISAARGDWLGMALSIFSAAPAVGDAAALAKIAKNAPKYAEALAVVEAKVLPKLPDRIAKPLKEFIGKAKAKLDEMTGAKKDLSKPESPKKESEPPKGGNDTQVKNKRTGEKGRCGEKLAKMDMMSEGFDEVIEVQNNSGHGVDLIGRNSKTGEVKVWEVKTTDGASAPSLSKDQARMGGEKYTNSRLERAAEGLGNYGKVPEAMENAKKANKWIERAGGKVGYEKREVFIDDITKGCMKNPNKPSKSQSWPAKK